MGRESRARMRSLSMKRVITFSGDEQFRLIHQGFLLGGNMQEKKGMVALRNEARILDKFDAVSDASLDESGNTNKYPSGDSVRILKPGVTEMLLTPDEHHLLLAYVEAVPWSTRISREVVRIFDMINSAPERADSV